jgi:polyisoprenoid-binding protein YceI
VRWPAARFVSREVVHREGRRYAARGELSIRDRTREAVLPFTLAIGADPEAADRLRRRRRASSRSRGSTMASGRASSRRPERSTKVVIRIAIVATRPR